MLDALLNISAAFGLSAASGLNASLPLALVGLLARAGAISLAPPYNALASDVALAGLLLVATLEFLADKVPGLDSVAHALLFPLSVAAGAILFASQTGAVTSVQPGAQIVIGLLVGGATSGLVHSVRAGLRPVANLAGLGPVVSTVEDGTAAVLAGTALAAPPLVPIILLALLVALVLFVRLLISLGSKALGSLYELLRRWFGGRFGASPGLGDGEDDLDSLDLERGDAGAAGRGVLRQAQDERETRGRGEPADLDGELEALDAEDEAEARRRRQRREPPRRGTASHRAAPGGK